VIVLETAHPTAIRREVSLSEAVYREMMIVEDMTALLCEPDEIEFALYCKKIPVIIDPCAEWASAIKPLALVDAILAKKNLGTRKDAAKITIGLGPGFTAPEDVDVVIETMRGHDLGRLITHGAAIPNTATPAPVSGFAAERVIYSPIAGSLRSFTKIGDSTERGQIIAKIGDTDIPAPISGILRGILPDGFDCWAGLKLADIDPCGDYRSCFTISDKARCIGGAVLEAIMMKRRQSFD